ncbi:MAG: hypothetical protein L3J74_04020 [Bacteroidales bacterium]|nr:hypothetical protein [Bacteroidales bacterium]
MIIKNFYWQSLILSFFLSFINVHIKAQQFSLEFGRVISVFDYTNSDGEKLDNLQGTTNSHTQLSFNLPIHRTKFYFLSGLAYNKYGAIGSDATIGNYYSWSVNYISLSLGAGYEFFKLNTFLNYQNVNTYQGFTFYVQLSGSFEYLIQGTQTINNTTYNLIGVEQFDKPFIFGYGGIGVRYYATKTVSTFFLYTGGISFSVFKSEGDNEKLNYITHTFSLGVTISLPAKARK